MRMFTYNRMRFTGAMWLVKEDPQSSTGAGIITYEKDVEFDFTDDPDAPRQMFIAREPFPHSARIVGIRNIKMGPYGEEISPYKGAEFKITSVQPVINPFGKVELYRMQAVVTVEPDFGYQGLMRD